MRTAAASSEMSSAPVTAGSVLMAASSPSRWSPPAARQLFHAIRAAWFDGSVHRSGVPIAALRTLSLDHAGHRLPRLGVDCPRCCLILPACPLVHWAHSPSRLLFMSVFLPSADWPSRCYRYVLSLGTVSPHLVHSSKSHESHARMLRWKQANARSSGVMALAGPPDRSPGPPGRA
jgi:hypothetical protein